MIHQYYAQRNTMRNGKPVGTVAVGTILYLQDCTPFRFPKFPICREPWIVEAWLPRFYDLTQRYCRGGHLAVVRSLRTGRVKRVADWLLKMAQDAELEK